MVKALLLFLTTITLAAEAAAQNLVPNPSFEDTSSCDQYPAGDYEFMLGLARPWFSANMASPDIYDCNLERQCGVPMDPEDFQGVMVQGFQLAHDGQRMAAAIQWYGPDVPPEQDTRDYLMVRLIEPLVAQQAYHVSLWYSRAEGYKYAVDHIGVHFGLDSISADHPTVLDIEPQVELRDPFDLYLIEGSDWIQLIDTFIAVGGEQWMTIGMFQGSDEVDGIEATTPGFDVAYYYFDAIAVEPLDVTGIDEFNIWYTANGMLVLDWRCSSLLERVRVLDASGRLIMERYPRWSEGIHDLEITRQLNAGIYLVEGISGGRLWVAKFVKKEGGF